MSNSVDLKIMVLQDIMPRNHENLTSLIESHREDSMRVLGRVRQDLALGGGFLGVCGGAIAWLETAESMFKALGIEVPPQTPQQILLGITGVVAAGYAFTDAYRTVRDYLSASLR